MKLNARELPTITFKRALPSYLAGGAECYIEVDARPGGAVNPAFLAAQDQILMNGRTRLRMLGKVADDAEHVLKDHEYATAMARDRFSALYDTCVISWRSNIHDDGKPIACNRDNFLALAEQRVPELAQALVGLQADIIAAGKDLEAETEAVRKN